jgi:predicted 3-demethylubiquinone-9 3-methyltransferase (glyoxalase superfamily)
MQKIQPTLWYDGAAEDALRLYASLVLGSAVGRVARFPEAGTEVHGQPSGSVMTVEARLGDTQVVGLNGGPQFSFTPALSLFVTLDTEADVDRVWEGLVDGGRVLMPLGRYDWRPRYGWLADRWGLTWQVALRAEEAPPRTVVPALLFGGERAGQAETALRHYAGVFPGSRIDHVLHRDDGLLMHGAVRLGDEPLTAMDSPEPHAFDFSEAVSLMVLCEDQAEIDRYWTALSAVPEAEACGWLKDRFGVSWQIVPRGLDAMFADPDPTRVERIMNRFLTMKKIDIPTLEAARAA